MEGRQPQDEEIEKSNPYARQKGGRFGFEYGPDTGLNVSISNNSSNEVKHDGEFVLTKNGSKDFGEITPEMSKMMKRQGGKIRLRIGIENEPKIKGVSNYGEKHINRDLRNKNLRDIGFNNARDFIEYIAEDISYIFSNGTSLIAVREKDGRKSGAWMELTPSEDGDFYDVKTAAPLRKTWYKNKAPIWINPKLGALTKSLGDPPTHQFKKIIESIYGVVSHSSIKSISQNKIKSMPTVNKSILHDDVTINIKDVTVGNRQAKIDCLEKSFTDKLNYGKALVEYVEKDDTPVLKDLITLRIARFDKEKIDKAVRTLLLLS